MIVSKYPSRALAKTKSTLVLGSFEAFHLGHVALIEKARSFKQPITILIIANIQNVPGKGKVEYETLGTRLQQLSNFGIDKALIVEFNSEIRNKPGREFLTEVIDATNATKIVIGKDFAMGFNRDLDASNMSGFFPETYIVDLVKFNNQKLSTSTLKELAELGSFDVIKKLSPFAYTLDSRVDEKNNFKISTITPQRGIYAAWSVVNDIKYWSLIKIGFDNNFVFIPDLQIKNAGYDISIEMRKIIRVITRREHDMVVENDKVKVVEYLKQNL